VRDVPSWDPGGAWGWLWGVCGMLFSIPIIVIVKVVSQHVEQLQPVTEPLGK
jgi:predicted PurR-regulated permease PerM